MRGIKSVLCLRIDSSDEEPFRRESGTDLRVQSFLGKQDEREFFRTTVTIATLTSYEKSL